METYEMNHSGATFFKWISARDLTYHTHLHFSFEFVFCLEGEIRVTIGESTCLLRENQGALIPCNTLHSYHTPSHSQIYSLLVGQGLVQDIGKLFRQQRLVRSTFFVDALLRQMVLEQEKQTVFGIKAVVYRAFEAFMEGNSFQPHDTADHAVVTALPAYLQAHFRENVTLADFARYSDYNYFYVSKLIKRSFGISFSRLLTEYRIAYAQELLQEKKLTVSQIALLCGYGSIRNFNRVFFDSVGKTPREYSRAREV